MHSFASEHSFFKRWFWRWRPGKGGGTMRFICNYFSLYSPAKVGLGFTWPFLTFWLWSQLGGHEILSQLRDNQRKSQSLDVNFITLLRYPSQQAWHLSSMDEISVMDINSRDTFSMRLGVVRVLLTHVFHYYLLNHTPLYRIYRIIMFSLCFFKIWSISSNISIMLYFTGNVVFYSITIILNIKPSISISDLKGRPIEVIPDILKIFHQMCWTIISYTLFKIYSFPPVCSYYELQAV